MHLPIFDCRTASPGKASGFGLQASACAAGGRWSWDPLPKRYIPSVRRKAGKRCMAAAKKARADHGRPVPRFLARGFGFGVPRSKVRSEI